MRLLIADDENIIRAGLLKLDWASIGVDEIRVADNGIEALEIISKFQPQLILTDIRMPGLNGLQLAKEIMEAGTLCKVILLSGYGTFEHAKEALHSDVFEFLLKPSNPSEILETVKRAKLELERAGMAEFDADMKRKKKEIFAPDTSPESSIRLILEYIEHNYMNNISLTTLSEYSHFSTTYLSKLIKKETSYNFTKILSIVRMLKAAELLCGSKLKIYAICERIGMNDQRYFSQLFHKTFGKTPAEYRKARGKHFEGNLMDFVATHTGEKG